MELALVGLSVALYRLAISPAVKYLSFKLMGRPAGSIPGLKSYPGHASIAVCIIASASIMIALRSQTSVFEGVRSWDLPVYAAILVITWRGVLLPPDARNAIWWQVVDRCALLCSGVAALVSPSLALVVVLISCGRLGGWTHHAHLPVRILKASASFGASLAFISSFTVVSECATLRGGAAMILGVFGSHYMSAAIAKIALGERPWSWIRWSNTLSLPASAGSWGWPIGTSIATRTSRFTSLWSLNASINGTVLLLEASALLVGFGRLGTLAWLVGIIVFHVLVFAMTGLLFWENIAVAITLLCWIDWHFRGEVFGFELGLLVAGVVVCGVAGAWKPAKLGWWDTPLSQRVELVAVAASGRRTTIPNREWGPFEREFGRYLPQSLAKGKRFVTFGLGATESERVARALPDLAALFSLESAGWGVERAGPRERAELVSFLGEWAASARGRPLLQIVSRLFRTLCPPGHNYYNGRFSRAPFWGIDWADVDRVEAWLFEDLNCVSSPCHSLAVRGELVGVVSVGTHGVR